MHTVAKAEPEILAFVIDELAMRGFHLLPAQLTWRLHDRALQHIRARGVRLAPRVVRCRAGFRLLVDPADWIGSHIAVRREFEAGLSRIIERYVGSGDHFVDVGANIGYFSLLAAGRVGDSGCVSAFEASPITRHALLRNVRLNAVAHRVAVLGVAAWDGESELTLHQGPWENAGLSTLGSDERSIESFTVRAVALDDCLPFHERPVRFVKIDVEGAEYHVLLGMRRIVDACRPMIALELSPRFLARLGHTATEVLDLLTVDFGYTAYEYDEKGRLFRADVAALRAEPDQQNNLVLLPPGAPAR